MKMTFRLWLLLFFLIAALFALNPLGYFKEGVLVQTVMPNSSAALAGLEKGEIMTAINDQKITSFEDFTKIIPIFNLSAVKWTIKTAEEKEFSYESLLLGIEINENLTITAVFGKAAFAGLEKNLTLKEVNGEKVESKEDFYSIKQELEPKTKLKIKTDKGERTFFATTLDFTVSEIPKTNLRLGLDLAGGAKALVKPEKKLSSSEMNDLIQVSKERLNVYGLADIVIRSAKDLSGNNYMLVEVAGATPTELEELIGKQGKFEAKIGNETVFIGGKKDITSICRNDASCAGIRECQKTQEGYWCRFEFVIYLSEEAAQKQANITDALDINVTPGGERILSKPLDLYLDDNLVDSLQIDAGLKGRAATQILIRGPGSGSTEQEALEAAEQNMAKLQTVLITGSLPFKLEIVKLDSISPLLGKEFVRNIFYAGFAAAFGVIIVIFLRYRKLKLIFPVFLALMSEIFIILGFAALIRWNLDLASIAGIVAAIGTGVDDQILIIDETSYQKQYSIKERIKRAFFIILGAFATTFVAMIPLWWAGAGMIRGFALTTLLGISIGVLITRPAFANIIQQITKE